MLVAKIGPDGKPELDADGKQIMVEDGKGGPAKGKDGKPVTQEAIDAIWKQMREKDEELAQSEKEKVELVGRVSDLEKRPAPAPKIPPDEETVEYGQQEDGTWLFPKNKEGWDDLYDDSPTKATDLRYEYNRQKNSRVVQGVDGRRKSSLKVAEAHSDMFMKDAEGKVQLDEEGFPVPDLKSKKMLIFSQIAQGSGVGTDGKPIIFGAINGPELVASQMEKVLKDGKESELTKKAQEEKERLEKERQEKIRKGNLAPGGSPPPPPKKVEVKFNSDHERELAEKKVASGMYKSLEEYCATRDNKEIASNRGV